ncbi:MAG TPA: Nif3-like dinuclear metal center hexameric protein, partial [Burkholderiales bacterium]|nr:Nif3-like dinuclear metal center hexameric protein [Burkholderiales bacterium]
YLDQYLDVARFRDYCPNGLQVEGRTSVARLVTGVTASLALVEAAIAAHADAILAHHGYFWRGEDPRLVGARRTRIALLLRHDVNLYAFHLPLDAHPEVGNNAALAKTLGFVPHGRFGEQDLGWHGEAEGRPRLEDLAARVEQRLGRTPLVIGEPARPIRRVAWCTGAAQGYLEDAVRLGVDAYLSGEISEQTVHLSRESGVAFIAAGHHATERYGVQALGAHLAERFGIEHQFIDIPNPV